MKKKKAIFSALFLILVLFVGFNVAEPINATPDSLNASESDNPVLKGFSLSLVNVFDDDDDDDDEDDETDDDDEDDDETDDETDDDDDEKYTKEQAEDKIQEAEDKIEEVEDKIAEAISSDGNTEVNASDEDDDDEIDDDDDDDDETDDDDDDDDAIEEAQEELEDAKEHLAEAKAALAEGDYEEAYEEAEEAIEECEEALEELDENESGDEDDIDEDETAEEDATERNLHVTVLINGQDATSTTEANPMQVSGDAIINVIIENKGETIIIDEVEIKTRISDTEVSAFELSGATLSSGTSVEFTNTLDTGLIGALAELFGNPQYESKIEIKMENDWDYELVVYWQAV
jgi:HEPN domain-containing protein